MENVELILDTDVIAVVDLVDDTSFEALIDFDTVFVDVGDNVEDEGFVVIVVVVFILELCVDVESMVFLVTESYQISDIHKNLTRVPNISAKFKIDN